MNYFLKDQNSRKPLQLQVSGCKTNTTGNLKSHPFGGGCIGIPYTKWTPLYSSSTKVHPVPYKKCLDEINIEEKFSTAAPSDVSLYFAENLWLWQYVPQHKLITIKLYNPAYLDTLEF
jgi:hypothetical protein